MMTTAVAAAIQICTLVVKTIATSIASSTTFDYLGVYSGFRPPNRRVGAKDLMGNPRGFSRHSACAQHAIGDSCRDQGASFPGGPFAGNAITCHGMGRGSTIRPLAARGRSPEDRAQGSSGWLREVRSGHRGLKPRPQAPSFHRDRPYQCRTKPAGRLRPRFDTSVAPLRPKGYGETGPSSLSPTPPNECALSLLRGFGPAPRRLLESGPVWP